MPCVTPPWLYVWGDFRSDKHLQSDQSLHEAIHFCCHHSSHPDPSIWKHSYANSMFSIFLWHSYSAFAFALRIGGTSALLTRICTFFLLLFCLYQTTGRRPYVLHYGYTINMNTQRKLISIFPFSFIFQFPDSELDQVGSCLQVPSNKYKWAWLWSTTITLRFPLSRLWCVIFINFHLLALLTMTD